jgi:hypothetical protein
MFERMQNWVGETLALVNRSRRAGKARPKRAARRVSQALFVEALEDRTVPTVVFAPKFGTETPVKDGGQRINSPNVYVVLWGSYWGNLASANTQTVFAATSAVVSGHYLDGLSQYGVTTNAHYKDHIVDTSDPKSGFTETTLFNEIETLITNNQLPDPNQTPNMIVDMVTAPTIKSAKGSAAGYNDAVYMSDGSFRYGLIWNGTSFGNLSLRDSCSLVFSHELAESMTSPGGNGLNFNKGPNWTLRSGESSPNQIGDFEGNQYSYRLPTEVLVQPYWSAGKNTPYPAGWLVTDGNTQTLNVSPNWTGNNFKNYDLTVNGNNLTISSDAFGLTLALDNQSFELDSDYVLLNSDKSPHLQLGTLTANMSAGVVHINGAPAMTGITVTGRAGTEVDIADTAASVSVDGAGTVNVGRSGSLRKINAGINIVGRSRTNLTIDDANNQSTRPHYDVLDSFLNENSSESAVTVGYTLLHSLTINGGSGSGVGDGTDFKVEDTPSAPTTLNTGTGIDSVVIEATSGPLTVNGQAGADTVAVGSGGSTQFIGSSLNVTNSVGSSAVTVDDSSDGAAHTVIVYTNTTSGFPVNVIDGLTPHGDITLRNDAVRSLNILAGAGGNTFRIHNTPVGRVQGGAVTTVKTGAQVDTVTIDGSSGPLIVDGTGGADNVNIGTGNLQTIGGPVTVTNTGGFSNVTVDDRGDTKSSRTVLLYNNSAADGISTVIDGFPLGGDILLRGAELASLTIRAGNLGNIFRIHDTPTSAAPDGMKTSIETGRLGDTVTVDGTTGALDVDVQQGVNNVFVGTPSIGLDRIHGPVKIVGASPRNNLTFNDTSSLAGHAYYLYGDHLQRTDLLDARNPDAAPISFASMKTVTLTGASGPGNVFYLYGNAAGTTVDAYGTAGSSDEFFASVDDDLSALAGPVHIHGQTADNDYVVYEDSNPSSKIYTLSIDPGMPTVQHVDGSNGAVPVTCDGMAALILYTPAAGGNALNIQGVVSGLVLITACNTSDQVTIGSNAPALGGTLANILGTVAVEGGYGMTGISLTVDDSTDTADHSATIVGPPPGDPSDPFTTLSGLVQTPIEWSFAGGSAQVSILGGLGNDSFVVQSAIPDVALSIDGGGGRNLLIAGASACTLIGGGDQDILIAGTTDYDQDPNAIAAIMTEWTSGADYATRVADLENGNGVPLLNSTTVHSNGGGNTLNGNAGLDFFFANLAQDAFDRDPLTEELVAV